MAVHSVSLLPVIDCGGGTSVSTSKTILEGDYLLCFCQFTRDNSVNAPTWDGVTMTEIAYFPNVNSGWQALGVWGLRNFRHGTLTFAATAGNASTWFQLMPLKGVDFVRNVVLGQGYGTTINATGVTVGDHTVGFLRTAQTYNMTTNVGLEGTWIYGYGGSDARQSGVAWCATPAVDSTQSIQFVINGTDVPVTTASFSLVPMSTSTNYLQTRKFNRINTHPISLGG